MKKSLFAALLLLLGLSFGANAQSFLVNKTLLDSIKPYTFHGAVNLSVEFKQSDSRSFSANAGATLLYPTNRNQLKLSGNIKVNLLDGQSNDNKGFICFNGMLDQFKITAEKREKTVVFYDLYASYNYDFVRDLHSRAMAGVNVTFQPLREHPHLCLEPSIGVLFSYQAWQVLNPGNGPNTNVTMKSKYDQVRDRVLSDGSTVNDYYKIKANGIKEQIDPRVAASLRLWGTYNIVNFSAFLIVQQPMIRAFTSDAAKEEEIRNLVGSHISASEKISDYLVPMNNKCAPEVLLGASVSVRIYKGLSITTVADFFYDGSQLSLNSRSITYSLNVGFSYMW